MHTARMSCIPVSLSLWAEADALDLLAMLARSASSGTLRLIGAYRDTELASYDPVATLLADLAHAGLARQQTLAPLATEEVGRLLDAVLEGVDADRRGLRERVAQRTGGVPFFVLSFAQAVRLGTAEQGGAEALPWDVAQGIRQRVAALPRRHRRCWARPRCWAAWCRRRCSPP